MPAPASSPARSVQPSERIVTPSPSYCQVKQRLSPTSVRWLATPSAVSVTSLFGEMVSALIALPLRLSTMRSGSVISISAVADCPLQLAVILAIPVLSGAVNTPSALTLPLSAR